MKHRALVIVFAFACLLSSPPAQAQTNCYGTGQGPILSCFEGNRQVTVRKTFTYKIDGQYYAWDHSMNAYCFMNEYGKPRCMQLGQVRGLRCSEGKGGALTCE